MRLRLRKATNGNGHSNGHGPLPLTTSQLTSDIGHTKSAINSLAQERGTLALQSLIGDEGARLRIVEIDAERASLVASLETLEAALRQLQLEKRTTGWRDCLPRIQRAYRVEVVTRWGWSETGLKHLLLGRQSHDYRDLQAALDHLDQLEYEAARSAADNILPNVVVSYQPGDQLQERDARTERERLTELRKQHVEEAAREVIATCPYPRPTALEDMIKLARERMANRPDEGMGLQS